MKRIIFTLSLALLCVLSNQAQEINVKKSLFGVQIGLLGAWAYNESKLSDELAIRTELGLNLGVFNSFLTPGGTKTLWAPVINLEPRWYYNLERRKKKGKPITNNNGNFLSLQVSYHPDLFVISSLDNITIPNQISVIPTWGIRRHIGNHFTYETGFGIGYRRILDDIIGNRNDVAVNLHVRIGFDF